MTRRLSLLLFSLPICLAATVLFLSTGCGKKKSKSDSDSSTESETTSTDKTPQANPLMAASCAKDGNNLKQMAIAMHIYDSNNNKLPAAAICDSTGKPLLSWRVEILPFVEQITLYNKFNRNEPWDGPTNKPLLAQMPKLYESPGRSQPGDTLTYYRVIAALNPPSSPQPVFIMPVAGKGEPARRSIATVPDGTSNTIMIVESEEGVPWTKPDELIYNPKGPLPQLSYFYSGATQIALFDGSIRSIKKNSLSEQTLRNAITMDDGQALGRDW